MVATVLVAMFWYLIPLLVDAFREDVIPELLWPDFGGWLLAGSVGAYAIGTAAWWSSNRLLAEPLELQAAFVALKWLEASSVALTCAAWIMAVVLGLYSIPSGPTASVASGLVLNCFVLGLIALFIAHVIFVMGSFRKRAVRCPNARSISGTFP